MEERPGIGNEQARDDEQPYTGGATVAAIFEVVEEMRSTGPGEKNQRYNDALIADYRATGGKRTGELPPASVVLITNKGAKSGIERTVPVGCEVVEGRLLVVASAAGIERNPGWYHNLVANPIVTVEWQGEAFRAEAIVTQGEERDRLFNQLDEVYITLQAATARQFPIIELRRLEGAS